MKQVEVGIKLVGDGAKIPIYKTDRSSGADVYSMNEDFVLHPGNSYLVHTGVFLQIPDGYEIQVRARSGLSVKYGVTVLNGVGTIDSDYQGECCVILVNHGKNPWICRKGERIAQFVLTPVVQASFIQIEDFQEKTFRGQGGFGSTGMK